MMSSHVNSIMTVAEPFWEGASPLYNFTNTDITSRIRSEIPTLVHERLTPPPEESYSLHRKLSGCFLLCAKLGAMVPCQSIFSESVAKYKLKPEKRL